MRSRKQTESEREEEMDYYGGIEGERSNLIFVTRRSKDFTKPILIGVSCFLGFLLLLSFSYTPCENNPPSLTSSLGIFGENDIPDGPYEGVSILIEGETGKTIGVLVLKQESKGSVVKISGEISSLSPNSLHGLHVHENGDMRQGCNSTGSHFNPYNKTHGGPTDVVRHVGDLGNIMTNSGGVASVSIEDSVISLAPGINCIIGRAFVVHSGEDDLGKGGVPDSLKTGNAGSKFGCGLIGLINNPTS